MVAFGNAWLRCISCGMIHRRHKIEPERQLRRQYGLSGAGGGSRDENYYQQIALICQLSGKGPTLFSIWYKVLTQGGHIYFSERAAAINTHSAVLRLTRVWPPSLSAGDSTWCLTAAPLVVNRARAQSVAHAPHDVCVIEHRLDGSERSEIHTPQARQEGIRLLVATARRSHQYVNVKYVGKDRMYP